ncbi:MAG: MnmC family methyltransferase, partial [Bacteriovoracia bacterium]
SSTTLATYSSSSRVRKALLGAGWTLEEGEQVGNKSSSTRAKLNGPTCEKILTKLRNSPVKAYRD